jgi:glyoxylase-like metal-dependent hydrolase (beta-lactamase superfamily II)
MSDQDWTAPGAFEVAPGVHRIPLPLPSDGLRAVNVYALDAGPDGCVLVDSGWALAEARKQLEDSLGRIGHDLGTVTRFLVTHVHRDHYTLGVELRRTFGSRVALGAGEQPNLDAIADPRRTPDAALRRWGAEELVAPWRAAYDAEARARDSVGYEQPDQWLADDDAVQVGARRLRVLATPGHTRGHVVFLDEAASVLFAGDHVLPHITPSIGFQPAPVADPLGDYLRSLRLLLEHPDALLLPAHGLPGARVHARVHELLEHHEVRLAATLEAVRAGAGTAYEAARRLGWTRRGRAFDTLDLFNRFLATGETAAHLEVLVRRGALTCADSEDVRTYAPAGVPLTDSEDG